MEFDAIVLRGNKKEPHRWAHLDLRIAATLYEVCFNHFFRAGDSGDRDVVFYQGTRRQASIHAPFSKAG